MPRKSSSKPQRKKTVSFEKRVMAVVQRQAETKQKVINLFNNASVPGSGLINNATTGVLEQGLQVNNILSTLDIAQGLEQEQRQGNEISNCKLRVRGLLESLPYNATNNPSTFSYEVHMVIFKKKDDTQASNLYLKSAPGNIQTRCDGTLINTMYPYNKDTYTIKKVKVFRMAPYIITDSNQNNTPVSQPNTYLFKRFRFEVPIAKKLKFNDSPALPAPTNDWCSIGFYVVNADGSINTLAQSRCQLTMDATIRYDDF